MSGPDAARSTTKAKDEIRDRAGLARLWLANAIAPPTFTRFGNMLLVDFDTDLAKRLMGLWLVATKDVALDQLGKSVERPPVAWLSVEAVRAAYLEHALTTSRMGSVT